MHDWSQTFVAHSAQHLVVVLVCAAITGAVCLTGRGLLNRDLKDGLKVPSEGRERAFRLALGWSIILTQIAIHIRRLTPNHWDLGDSLPLHLCRISVWFAAWMLLTLDTRARALTLYWGIGLSAQIFVTPYLHQGHGSLAFWIYWLNHLQIVGAAVYDIVVLGYRPSWKDFRFASLAGLVYTIVVVAINAALGTNYSYLGRGEHAGSSLVDALGPYPWRVVWMAIGGAAIFLVITLFSRTAMTLRCVVLGKPAPRRVDKGGVRNAPAATVDP